MTDLFREVDEAIRQDRAKALWDKYGALFIGVAVALVLATAAYVLWQNHQASRNQELTTALAAALGTAQRDPQAGAAALAALAGRAQGGQAMLAQFYEAGLRAQQGDRETAALIYRQMAGNAALDRAWRDLALLLAVLHEADRGDPAALSAELQPLTADDQPWRYTARELTALLALRQGDPTRARELLRALSQDVETPTGVRNRAAELTALLGE